jgi:chemotaxis methyl-accepting protein methylase
MLAHRGALVPVIDLRAELRRRPARTSTRLVLVHYRRPAAPRLQLGLILEQATETLRCQPDEFQPYGLDNAEALPGAGASGCAGCCSASASTTCCLTVRQLLYRKPGRCRHDGQRFFRFLQERIGLDVESVGRADDRARLRQRCVALRPDLDDYWLRLQQSDEQQALIEAVIVPETWFFRYPESFTALAAWPTSAWPLAGARPLRILSLPCSTGEEPYSIAMALLDAGVAGAASLSMASTSAPVRWPRPRARVWAQLVRGSELAFRERHFSEPPRPPLDERVRQQVSLQVGNVLDPALARDGQYDFVFCRNLLIYFDVPTQQRCSRCSSDSRPGVLFIGPAEGSLLARLGMRLWGSPSRSPMCARLTPHRPHHQTAAGHAPVAHAIIRVAPAPAPASR